MKLKHLVPTCFGAEDGVLGEHPVEEARKHTMIKEARGLGATDRKAREEIVVYLESMGASDDHREAQGARLEGFLRTT
jgi:hypothetical protein